MDSSQLTLQQMDDICNAFYTSTSAQERSHANQVLMRLMQEPDAITRLNVMITSSVQPNTLVVAATGLHRLITQHWVQVPDSMKTDMRNFLLNILAQRGPEMLKASAATLQAFVRLLCRLVKLAWLEGPQHQNITEQVSQFLQASTLHWVVGLEIYTELTTDMQPQIGPAMSRYRRTALSFRDSALPQIFNVGISTLQQYHTGQLNIPDKNEEARFLKQVLRLTCNCLSFDFMGTIPDETADDQTAVMVPQSWSVLREETTPGLFFDIYAKSCQGGMHVCAALSLQCLVLMSSLRRSFFPKEEDRSKLMTLFIQGTTALLSNKLGLEDPQCYHETCRLLGKINANHQLTELTGSDAFNSWIEQVYHFTMEALKNWKHMPNSKHYLLGVWSSMVSPIIFLRERAPKGLDVYIQHITLAYIHSRLLIAEATAAAEVGQNGHHADLADLEIDDPLGDDVLRAEQLEVLASLGRNKYSETAQQILTLFEGTSAAGAMFLQPGMSGQAALAAAVFEKKITWLVYMIAALVGGHATSKTPISRDEGGPQYHVINGELSSRVFQMIAITDQQAAVPEQLELAYLYFLEQFRKVYVSEHAKVMVQMQVSERLCTVLGLKDEDAVLGLLIQKIGRNLQHRINSEAVIKRTLLLFHELACGINIVHSSDRSPHLIVSGRLLLKNETVRFLIANHASPSLGFLNVPQYGKYRTMYYHTLGKLLFMDIRDNKQQFDEFCKPLETVIRGLWEPCLANREFLRQPQCRGPLIGLLRDLRGLCLACTSSEPYVMLFQWLVDNPKQHGRSKISLFTHAMEFYWEDPAVTTPLLKFMAEFVHNKAQRITFDQASANGILLFREVSSILVTYGNRILQKTQFSDMYKEKYKGLAVALEMLSHSLQGNYTNFGVFEVYQDHSLSASLGLALRMCLAIPLQDLSAYLKTLKPYYLFLELITRSHIAKVMELEPVMLSSLMASVEEGLLSFESGVNMQCCAIVDNIVSHFFLHRTKDDADGQAVRNFLTNQPGSLRRILNLMFQLVITGEFTSTWSMSRPLLGLILLHENEYLTLKDQISSNQVGEKKQKLQTFFVDLMSGVEPSLTTKNKDHFTRNLYQFAQLIRTSLV